MSASLLILGAGGHARVVLGAFAPGLVRGYLAPEAAPAPWPAGIAYLGDDDALETLDPAEWSLVNGVGALRPGGGRRRLFETAKLRGFGFTSALHPRAMLEPGVSIGEGAQIMAGAIVQCGVAIGANAIVNTGAIVDHDCVVADHVHIGPGACLSGGVTIGMGAHVGVGATILQNVRIGAGALVGAGAVVVADVAPNDVVVGVPARPRPTPRGLERP